MPLDPKIRLWATEVVTKAGAKTDLEKARAIYEHVVSTVTYDKTGQGWGRGDIYYACDARRGNCTDFHAVFIGYCRAVGIPARFSIGFPLPPERGAAEVKGYHCWAEFFTPETGWVPVDASEAAKNPSPPQLLLRGPRRKPPRIQPGPRPDPRPAPARPRPSTTSSTPTPSWAASPSRA